MNNMVLVIEDNTENIYLIRYLLTKNGFTVIEAETGKLGIERASEGKYDIILLDIQLPEMDGYNVATELRKMKELADIPIIAVTSYAMVGDKEKALACGATGYIEKPIDPDSFISEIRKFMPE